MSEIKVELTREACEFLRNYFVAPPTGGKDTDGDRIALVTALIAGANSFDAARTLTFTYPQVVETLSRTSARLLRDVIANVLRDGKRTRVHAGFTTVLSKLDDWLDTPVVDRIAGLG